MSFDDYSRSLSRTITWRVLLHLDYCTLTYGQSPCQATGTPYCYYTYPTCKDPVNYSRGTKVYAFSMADGPLITDCLPYIRDVKTVPTEIRPDKHVTRRARITVDFNDDSPLALANPDKTYSNVETKGSFFRNLIARNPNASGRIAEVWQGFDGLPVSGYRLVFQGVIEDMEWEEGRARIVIKDQLKLLDKKIPPKQSSDNVLTATYNGGSTMAVTDGAEFEYPGEVKVENEYIIFTGVSANSLTGCSPGAYGTTPASHAAGKKVQQVVAFAEPLGGNGLPPDEIFLSLLCTHGGIDPLTVAVVDRGANLSAAVSGSDTALPVDLVEPFPETGIVRIDNELIRYRGVSGSSLQVVQRGAYGTTAAAHDLGKDVLLTRFTDELGRWMAGTLFRRLVEQSTSIKNLVNDLREQSLIHVWQAEDSTIAAKCVAPPYFSDTPKELSDESGFIDGSTSWDSGHDLQATRITVHYDPTSPDAGKKPESYNGLLVIVDADVERADYFGKVKNKEIWGTWIFREQEAMILGSRYLIRYRNGVARFKFAVELKDDDLEVGGFVRITSRDIIDPAGATQDNALFEVIKKMAVSDNRIEFVAIDTRLNKRYPVISPTTMTSDYDGASEEDRQKYGWIGDSNNKVGTAAEDGYYIY